MKTGAHCIIVEVSDHWPLHARQWSRVGPPLRPATEDVAIAEAAVADLVAPRALLLGVTPELATMRWPAGTSLAAIDRSPAMIEAVFPATGTPAGTTARVGEWAALAVAAGSVDVIVGDGCLSTCAYPDGYRAFAREQHRVLAPGGRLILRLFALPEPAEPLASVAAALARGRIGNFHVLKWRIAMAIQRPDRNVAVAAILRAFDELVADRATLAWDRAVIDTIDVYRDSLIEYSFPTLAEVRAVLAEHFGERACHTPSYELGERCPTVVVIKDPRNGDCQPTT